MTCKTLIQKNEIAGRIIFDRLLLIMGIFSYTVVFQWIYATWLNPYYDYMGFTYNQVPEGYLILAFILSIIPGFWMPVRLSRPSQLIYWVLYLAVYIPAMFVSMYIGLQPLLDVAMLMLSLFAGFIIIGSSYLFPLLRLKIPPLQKTIFWYMFFLIVIILTAWIIFIFRGNMRIVSFYNIYKEVRFTADDVMAGSFVGYAIMCLSGVFNPFLISWGLVSRRIIFIVAGTAGQVLIYSIIGSKSAVLSVPILLFFYIILRKNDYNFGLKLIWGGAGIFFMLNSINLAVGDAEISSLKMLSAIILMRTFGMPGLLVGQYHNFFQNNPLTYLSHVNIIKMFRDYPYLNPIGIEIGNFYYGEGNINANANFWITDGLAGFGLTGILFISFLCALVFWFLDSAAEGHDPVFTALLIGLAAVNISNISLFTALLSGGLGFCILILYLMPREAVKGVKVSKIEELPVQSN